MKGGILNNREEYKITPLREKDIFKIMKWRNDQIEILRQPSKLTRTEQQEYYNNIVKPSFNQNEPDLILFSFLKHSKLVGYGGLVHINWIDRTAEISFLVDTALNEKYFEEFWSEFLLFIEDEAFHHYDLRKIYTYSFNIRPRLYTVLKQFNFFKESKLKFHHLIKGRGYIDGLFHSKFSPNFLNLRPGNINDSRILYTWRHQPSSINNSFSCREFSYESHLKWFSDILKKDSTQLFILEYCKEPIGQIRFEKENMGYELSYSISEKFQGRGFGTLILQLGLSQNTINSSYIIAHVKKTNQISINLFIKLGFKIKSIQKEKISFHKYSDEN